MINFTFQKEVSDIPMILPVEMFIVEEETAAPEFQEEINEVIPTLQEEVIEEVVEVEEAPEITEPVVEETLPEVSEPEPPVKEIVSECISFKFRIIYQLFFSSQLTKPLKSWVITN